MDLLSAHSVRRRFQGGDGLGVGRSHERASGIPELDWRRRTECDCRESVQGAAGRPHEQDEIRAPGPGIPRFDWMIRECEGSDSPISDELVILSPLDRPGETRYDDCRNP